MLYYVVFGSAMQYYCYVCSSIIITSAWLSDCILDCKDLWLGVFMLQNLETALARGLKD